MGNNNNNSLEAENEQQDIEECLNEEDWDEVDSSLKPASAKEELCDKKRAQVRRNIEEIQEKRRLKELLGDDYDL
ncbi:PA3496 family putative envelope integrity protein [Psychromonas aquimarina]|uniref:PA3496 family putative envelope integrity protein n=1 Tax=Psychromonas aquimarina TaxID=444919 RepID=UPI000409FBA6|nr:hypothetical protein [Psychromonas aquimarina]